MMDFRFLLNNDSAPLLGFLVGAIFACFPDWLVRQDLAFQKRFLGLDLSWQHETIASVTRLCGVVFILVSLLGML